MIRAIFILLIHTGWKLLAVWLENVVQKKERHTPPSIYFTAFSASSGFSKSTYAKPFVKWGWTRSITNSAVFIGPYVANISCMCSLLTFLVRCPMCIFVARGVGLLFFLLGERLKDEIPLCLFNNLQKKKILLIKSYYISFSVVGLRLPLRSCLPATLRCTTWRRGSAGTRTRRSTGRSWTGAAATTTAAGRSRSASWWAVRGN